MANKLFCLAAMILCFMLLNTVISADDSLPTKCAQVFQKVTNCLPFATAKAATPNAQCCSAVTDVRATDPVCLCYIIQQVHNGSNAAVKSMGVQESRLLQLPSVCRVANASVADCPRLLNLPPNSPDAAIFTNTVAAIAPGASGSSTASQSQAGLRCKPRIRGSVAVLILSFFLALPSSLMS